MSAGLGGWGLVLKINGRFLAALILGAAALFFWRIAVGDWVMFRLFSAQFAGAALYMALYALWGVMQLIWHHLTVARFRRLGVLPKADRAARERDLRVHGVLK